MPNLPKMWNELTDEAVEIVSDGFQPCEGCGRVEYTEETACEVPDGDERPGDQPQHCEHWYDCEPCHKCGDWPMVLYGPPLAFKGLGDRLAMMEANAP